MFLFDENDRLLRHCLCKVISELDGKDVNQVIKDGLGKLASIPCGEENLWQYVLFNFNPIPPFCTVKEHRLQQLPRQRQLKAERPHQLPRQRKIQRRKRRKRKRRKRRRNPTTTWASACSIKSRLLYTLSHFFRFFV